jgi:hypothetical protein
MVNILKHNKNQDLEFSQKGCPKLVKTAFYLPWDNESIQVAIHPGYIHVSVGFAILNR